MDVDFIIKYEAGEATDEEIVEHFQKGVDDGSVWQLQGHYGQMAEALIESNIIVSSTRGQ